MSDMLDLDDQPKIIKKGSPQALTCGDPSHRRDDRIRTCDPLTPSRFLAFKYGVLNASHWCIIAGRVLFSSPVGCHLLTVGYM
jgi:hypothetical protein